MNCQLEVRSEEVWLEWGNPMIQGKLQFVQLGTAMLWTDQIGEIEVDDSDDMETSDRVRDKWRNIFWCD